jgi:hypothetical protein
MNYTLKRISTSVLLQEVRSAIKAACFSNPEAKADRAALRKLYEASGLLQKLSDHPRLVESDGGQHVLILPRIGDKEVRKGRRSGAWYWTEKNAAAIAVVDSNHYEVGVLRIYNQWNWRGPRKVEFKSLDIAFKIPAQSGSVDDVLRENLDAAANRRFKVNVAQALRRRWEPMWLARPTKHATYG